MPKSVPSEPNPVRSQFVSGKEDQPVFTAYDLGLSRWKEFRNRNPIVPVLERP
jgi:hypothetical protein